MASPSSSHDFERRLIESFSKHALTYDQHARLQRAMAEKLASLLPDPLPERILEIGCGTGIFSRYLLARGGKGLILNDLAPGMIHHLQTHLTVSGETQFVVGNAETLSFPGVSLIGANAVFQWFRNPGGTLKRLRTCLDPGGYLVFSTFGPGTLREFRETGGFSGPASLHSLDGWKTLLTQADMEPVQALKEEKTLFFSGARELIRYLQQIGAAPLKIFQPGPLRRLLREYDSRYGAPEGILTRWELLFLAARTKSS